MSNKKIRNFSAEQKTKIVLEILESEKTLAEISKQYEVTSKTLQNWKKQFLENASLAFEPGKVVSEYKKEIEELKEQNDALAKETLLNKYLIHLFFYFSGDTNSFRHTNAFHNV